MHQTIGRGRRLALAAALCVAAVTAGLAARDDARPRPVETPTAPAEPAERPEQKEERNWRIAPDGVLYADRMSHDVMQKKVLSANLVSNPSFEQGRYWPRNWEPVDRLGTLWVKGGSQGKRCVKLDTNIQDAQWVAWNSKVIIAVRELSEKTPGGAQSLPTNPLPDPPERQPTAPPYYSTVAGLHGIHYRSDYIRLKPRAIYRFSVDSRCDDVVTGGSVARKVFVKGFFDQRMKSETGKEVVLKRNAYRARIDLGQPGDKWKRYAFVFHPARSKSLRKGKPIQPEWLQVQLYAYWPPGSAYFDNVRLEIVGYEELQPPAPKQGKTTQARPEPKLTEDEFPVFK